MRILIIAATEHEIQPFLESGISETAASIHVLITGVGMVATAYSLAKELSKTRYDLLVNVGIAGSFHKDIALGSLFRISKDSFSELGAEDDDRFLSLKDLGFGEVQFEENLANLSNFQHLKNLPIAKGITVNRVHGKETSIQNVVNQFSPDVETMEGAAVFYIAHRENIPAIQIRSISNLVEKRNRINWDIPLAIDSLNNWLIQFTTTFINSNPS